MRPVADAGRMAAIEVKAGSDYGLEARLLMENAAAALQSRLEGLGSLDPDLSLCVLAGRGNNGGDGLAVAARLAQSGKGNVTAVCFSGKLSAECAFRLGLARKAGLPILLWPDDRDRAVQAMRESDILLDAVSGIGLSSALREEEAAAAAVWNGCGGRKIAVDLPSGFRARMSSADPVFRADDTLCIGLVKDCLLVPAFRALAGKIHLLSTGIFPQTLLKPLAGDTLELEPVDLNSSLPRFPSDAYKTTRGSVAIFAGSVGGVGAARLCAEAAGRAGAGMVRLWTDAEAWSAAAAGCGGLVVKPLGADGWISEGEREEVGKADCALAGPGWGRGAEKVDALADIMARAKAAVLDADALFALSVRACPLPEGRTILTPHAGEAARLLSLEVKDILERPAESARELARRFRCVALLKGNVTWIADEAGNLRVFDGSFPPLGTAGSGDVLSGLAAGLLARGQGALEAASLAVLAHARAGRLAWKDLGYFLAQELCAQIPRAISEAEGGEGNA